MTEQASQTEEEYEKRIKWLKRMYIKWKAKQEPGEVHDEYSDYISVDEKIEELLMGNENHW